MSHYLINYILTPYAITGQQLTIEDLQQNTYEQLADLIADELAADNFDAIENCAFGISQQCVDHIIEYYLPLIYCRDLSQKNEIVTKAGI